MKRFLLFLVMFCSFALPLLSTQQKLYVSPAGSDSKSGQDTSNALATIDMALSKINYEIYNSLIIYVLPGTYNEVVNINQSGSSSFPISIQAYNPNNRPIFYGSSSKFSDTTITSVFSWNSNTSYITLNGIKIHSANKTKYMRGLWVRGDHNVIKHCELDTIVRSGIVIQGNYNTIDSNLITHIIGYLSDTLAGNNIDIEGYYNTITHARQNSENNTVKNDTCINNSTHFGINIFPDVNDPNQPTMTGNTIYNNYISNTGGGIYIRYQKNMNIFNNVIVQNVGSPYWVVDGGGIFLAQNATYQRTIDTSNIKIYNNTISDNQDFGIENVAAKNIYIKNNIIYNNGGWYIKFENSVGDTSCHISNNLYDSTSSTIDWKWNGTEYYFPQWKSVSKDTNSLIGQSPSYISSGNYKIQYGSTAKNAGVGLQSDGVTTDYSYNSRPYWNKDFDIGAYEVQGDAQLKMGIASGTNQSFTISTYGSYWERNSSGSFPISSNSSYSNSTFTVSSVESNLNKWRGWDLGWLSISNDSNKQFAHGIYKLKYSDTTIFIFIDYRDAVSNYSPNIYIKFDPSNGQFKYYDGSTFQTMSNGDILRIWTVNDNGVSNTSGLNNYWNNSLVYFNTNNHPFLIFGPYTSPSRVSYYEIQKIIDIGGGYDWSNLDSLVSGMSYQDATESLVLGRMTHSVAYEVVAHLQSPTQLVSSDSIAIKVNGPPLKQEGQGSKNIKQFEYSLNQNFPNPFNPSTTIQYSIKNPGLVKIELYDILGRCIETIVNEEKQAGEYKVTFNDHRLASGVYLYKLTSGTFTQTKKMQFIK